MLKNRRKMIAIAVSRVVSVVNVFLLSIYKSKAMKQNNQMQKDPGCCEPGSLCCGADWGCC